MTSIAFALVALAVLVAPAWRVRAVPGRRSGEGAGERAAAATRRAAALPVAGAVSAAGASLLALGPGPGAAAAAVTAPLAGLVVRWLQRRPPRIEPDGTLPLVLDLTAAGLRSGRPLAEAVELAARAGSPAVATALRRVATLARLGADPEQAWAAVPRAGPLAELARVAVRSAASGLKLASGLERLAAEMRAERAAAAAVRAQRAGVTAMAPLAACFLPSFVCLGIVPVLVGVARNTFSVLN